MWDNYEASTAVNALKFLKHLDKPAREDERVKLGCVSHLPGPIQNTPRTSKSKAKSRSTRHHDSRGRSRTRRPLTASAPLDTKITRRIGRTTFIPSVIKFLQQFG
jgi:hypothetical protein